MNKNETLQKEVQCAIKWEPLLNAAEIGVTAKDGVITLTGTVDNYLKKLEAEDAAKNVAGVTAVVEKIEIKFTNSWSKGDKEIATEVVNALDRSWSVPKDKVKVKVEDGWITLSGELIWNYQKDAAKHSIKHLQGVKGVTNNIKIKAEVKDAIEKEEIERALERNWAVNSKDIEVTVLGTQVTLTGSVTSLYEKDEAEKMAWNAPGIWSVANELVVEYDYSIVN